MSRPTLSLALIAKNEEENIERLFKSIEGCFDEVVLVDTGSTDKTVELAEKLGARVEHFTWVNDFSAARNYSFSKCTSDYIMWLDLDDVLEKQEAFKLWRDKVMMLADYWVATYHYASDAVTGNPTCSFIRERVVKREMGMEWKYFIHEGIIPNSSRGAVKTNYTSSWHVKHCRTDADLAKDRLRNLNIFEQNKTKLDNRMRYYYGKELFEAQKPVEAIEQLGIALSNIDLEMHDRMLAYQYIAYAYMQTERYEKALEIAHQGNILEPNRAELLIVIGDCYLKLGRLADAIPTYTAAKACLRSNGPTPIFHVIQNYTTYPRNQLARVWANLGNIDLAIKEAKECYELFNDQEAKTILDELEKMSKLSVGYKNAVECEDIVMTTLPQSPYLWDPEIAKTKAMGGSETAAIEMAKHLHKLTGRRVKVFNSRLQFSAVDIVSDGVEYLDNSKMHEYLSQYKPWVHIAWRHNNKVTDAPTYLWCHDLVTQGAENVSNYEKIFCLTPFHKDFVKVMQSLPDDKIHVTRNGIIPERFTGFKVEDKDPNMFVFSSSPDRGLDRTMRVLDKVREKHSDIKLHVFYGIEHLEKYGLKALQDTLKSMMDERKDWVIYHGATQQDVMMEHFKKAAYCVQPSDFIETSMISAMERVLCGVYQIIRKVGGAVDTLAEAESLGMATLVDSECITELEYQVYVDATNKAIEEEAYKRVNMSAEKFSWESVAKEWVEFFNSRHPKKEGFEVFKRIG